MPIYPVLAYDAPSASMLASTRLADLRQRRIKVKANTAKVLIMNARTKPGCQICSQVAVAVTLNSSAGRHSQTTIRLISEAAFGPRRLVRRQTKPTSIRAKIGSNTLSTDDIQTLPVEREQAGKVRDENR